MDKKKDQSLWDKYKYWIVISVVLIVLIISACCYSSISNYFFIENPKGEFLKVLVTIIGGSAIFIGLMLNNDRIKEQTRQNDISKSGNADSRFNDAIKHMSSSDSTIVLGGIYTLFQLATEDKRYVSIVAGILTCFLRENSHKLLIQSNPNFSIEEDEFLEYSYKAPIIVKTIIDLLFNNDKDVFKQELLDLSGVILVSMNFKYNVTKCVFDHSKLYCCFFSSSLEECSFEYSEIKYCYFGKEDSIINNCSFFKSGLSGVNFVASELIQLDFTLAGLSSTIEAKKMTDCNLQSSYYRELKIIGVQDFNKTFFNKLYKANIEFENCVDVLVDKYI